ncbi:AAA family ATPase [Planctomicrobium sp. SH527]|uniref:AAA family ATPase n=1 Tax=Planctomicrobium sp. SH527 TaxID=3448123 RepID=UPI003F5CA4CD
MTILRLHLKAYGPFTDRKIEFPSTSTGLHIIHGPNEAGKTSALRAIHAALYGIPTESKNKDQFAHAFSALRVGARLTHRNNSEVDFLRRPGRSKSLRDHNDDKALADDSLSTFLGNVDGDMFQSMFGIDHDRLRQGGAEMEKGEGKLGEILFTAGGVAELRQFQGNLDSKADELLTKKGQGGALAKASKDLTAARKKLTELQLAVTNWKEHHDEFERLTEERKTLDEQARTTSNELSRLKRLNAATHSFAPWKRETAALNELQHVTLLPDDFKERRIQTQSTLRQSQTTRDDAKGRIETIQKELGELVVPTDLLKEESAIEALSRRLGSDQKATADRIKLVADLSTARKNAERLLAELGRDPNLDAISELQIPENKRVGIRDLGSKYQGLFDKVQSTTAHRDKLKVTVTDLQTKLTNSTQVSAPTQLQHALNVARSTKDAPAQLEALDQSIDALKHEIDQQVKCLAFWSGTLEQLKEIAPPSDETIELFDERFRNATATLELHRDQHSQLQKDADDLTQRIIDIEKGQVVSTEEDLNRARSDRNRGWQLLIQHGLEATANVASEVAEYLSATPHTLTLREAFFTKVTHADALADTMRRDADRVANKSQLQSNHAEKLKQLTQVNSKVSDAAQASGELLTEWQKLWDQHGVTAGTPREMKSWRRSYLQILENVTVHRNATQSRTSLQTRLGEAIELLMTSLQQLVDHQIASDSPFSSILAEAENQLERLTKQERNRELWQQQLDESTKALKEAEIDWQQATDNLHAWEQSWKVEMQSLGLDGQAHIQQANSVLETLTNLSQRATEIEDYKLRIQGIDEDSAALANEVLLVTKRLDQIAIDKDSPEQIIDALKLELKLAKEKDTQRQTLSRQLAEQTERFDSAEITIKTCQTEMETLLQLAGCSSESALPELEKQSARRIELERSVSQLQNQLLAQAGQSTLEEFVAELNEIHPDELPAQIDQLQQDSDRYSEEREQLIKKTLTEQLTLKSMNGSAAAAEQLEDCEAMVAKLSEQARELMVLRIAGALLQAGMDRYREKSQGPILDRASQLFATLTVNSFRMLKTDYNTEGQPILVGIRGNNDQVIHVESMSEGTRDQLYLALRIASLEHWLDQNDPIPFIVDDILLTFDDERAVAALKVLSDLSRRTQVLFFTHHQHLVDLAEKHLAKENLHVHYLQQA